MQSVLVAGVGNIFHRDDAFGMFTVASLAASPLPENVRAVDFGIRGFDLMLALLDGYDVTILVDAVQRGGAPGTLYTIEPDPAQIGGGNQAANFENAHGLDPLKVLCSAKALGASLGKVYVVGCEPAVLDDDSGEIGLTDEVAAAVAPAVEMIRSLIADLNERAAYSSARERVVW